jgi:hypothetical protein
MASLRFSNIGDDGVRDLGAAMLVSTTLTTLVWGFFGCEKALWVQMAEREPRDHELGQCSHLHMGSLDGNHIGDEGAGYLGAAMRVNTTLTKLKWGLDKMRMSRWCGCERCGCVAVAVTECQEWEPHELGQCSQLHMGSLFDNNIGNAGARDLGTALRVNKTLTELKLGWGCGCYLRRGGCVAVAVTKREPNYLGHCSHLHMGSLGDNKIGDAGARDLSAALQVNTTLMTLMWGWKIDVMWSRMRAAVAERESPTPWPLLTLAPGQP